MVQKQPGYTKQIPAFGNLPKWERIQSDYTARRGNYLLPPLFYQVLRDERLFQYLFGQCHHRDHKL